MLTFECISGGTIYLSGDEELETLDRVLETQKEDGKPFVTRTNIEGIYKYGFEQTAQVYWGHKPGYIWASRASVMNAAFGITLYEACYRTGKSNLYRTCAIDLVRFEHFLKANGYSVDFTPIMSEDKCDVNFNVIKD